MKSPDNNAAVIPGLLFLGGAVYLWGALGIDPEAVTAMAAGRSLSEVFGLFKSFVYFGVFALFAAAIICAVLRLDFTPRSVLFRRNVIISLGILSLLNVPPAYFLSGASGIFIGILLLLANIGGLAGITLLASGAGGMLAKILPVIKTSGKKNKTLTLAVASVLFFLILALAQKLVLGGIPHVGDGVIQLMQAKIYAAGKFTVPAPAPLEFYFDPFLVAQNGRWFTQYPPGYVALLSLGVLIGTPQLINPLLTALSMILFGLVLREIKLETGWILLFALSPFVIFMSGSFMSHPAAMFFGALTLYFFLKSGRTHPGWLALTGLAAGAMFSTRSFTAVCFCLPLAAIAVRKRIGLGALLGLLGFVLGASPYFINNYFATGSFFTAGYQAAWGGFSGLLFGESPWGPPHTPQLGFLHLISLIQGLNSRLFELPLPALIGVVFWLLFSRRKGWKEWSLFAAGVCGFAGYFFYFYLDMVYGPRFAYASAFPLLIITALGFKAFYRRIVDSGVPRAAAQWGLIAAGVILLAVWGTVSLPARVNEYSRGYRDVRPDFIEAVEAAGVRDALVFLDDYPSSDRHARLYSLGFTNRQAWFYAWMLNDTAVESALRSLKIPPEQGFGRCAPLPAIGAALNRYWGNPYYIPTPEEDKLREHIPLKQGLIYMSPLIEKNNIIFARDFGAHNRVLIEKFPERKSYSITLKDGEYVITEPGNISPDSSEAR